MTYHVLLVAGVPFAAMDEDDAGRYSDLANAEHYRRIVIKASEAAARLKVVTGVVSWPTNRSQDLTSCQTPAESGLIEIFQTTCKVDVQSGLAVAKARLAAWTPESAAALITEHYTSNLKRLPGKSFHWLSRLYLWTGKAEYLAQLQADRQVSVGDEHPVLRFVESLEHSARSDKQLTSARALALLNYPKLLAYQALLSKVLFAKTVFKQDLRDAFTRVVPLNELKETSQALQADLSSLRTLSTHAVNFLTLSHELFASELGALDPKVFLRAMQLKSKGRARNDIYLATHAIIGASAFYAKSITTNLATYAALLSEAETRLETDYYKIPLDAKLELIIAARLLARPCQLEQRILSEALTARHPDAPFITDPSLIQGTNMLKSEHRNVLFVMALTNR